MADQKMIERIAKALWDNDQAQPYVKYGFSNCILFGQEWHQKSVPWEFIIDETLCIAHISNEWKAKAVLAIKAIREPTEKMLEAARDIGPDRDPSEYYQSMIDAILND